MPYIDRDVKMIRKCFYAHLSEPTKLFFDQYEKEDLEGFSEDGGLIISLTALAERIGFWISFQKTILTICFMRMVKAVGIFTDTISLPVWTTHGRLKMMVR